MHYKKDSQLEEEITEIKNSSITDSDLDDKGYVFGKYKRNFLLLFAMIVLYGILFILFTANIISLILTDVILVPITLIILVIYIFTLNHKD